jgi:hypothetical protein
MKPTCESAAVETSPKAGSPASGIRSDDPSMIESAKGARAAGRRFRSEGVLAARAFEVGAASRKTTGVGVTQCLGSAVRVTVIVEPPAVIEEAPAV